ncbi:MAG: putative aminohydrolase SsnA [Spirochaetaceae bacterium]|nr:putative aminohydrolase SsnA [Spirochaetaceae bacterium]
MTVFESVKLVSFEPPAVSEAIDVAVLGPLETVPEGAASGARAGATVGAPAGTILEIGSSLATKYPSAQRVSGGYLSPGLVCAHTHLYSALARGLAVAIEPSKDFAQQLRHLWWRLDRAIDLPILKASAAAGCAEALACGVTSLVDHHAGPEAIDGSLSVIREAYEELGLRGILCYETTDRNGPEGARAGIAENLRFAREIDELRASGRASLVDAAIGAHALFTIGDETLAALGDAVRTTGRGIHIHAAEDKYDAVDSRHRFGADLIARLDAASCLGPKSIIGHGVWLTESEAEILNVRGSFLAHNARSNMNNAVGYSALLPRFANVVLGTDGMSADMLEEFRFACFRHRESGGPWWPGDFLRCLDRGNRLIERYFGAAGGGDGLAPAFGRIKAGAAADLVLWDYDPPTPLAGGNLAGHMAFGLSSRSVRSVMVAGRFAIKDGKSAFDAAAIAANAREQAQRMWKRMEERR